MYPFIIRRNITKMLRQKIIFFCEKIINYSYFCIDFFKRTVQIFQSINNQHYNRKRKWRNIKS